MLYNEIDEKITKLSYFKVHKMKFISINLYKYYEILEKIYYF